MIRLTFAKLAILFCSFVCASANAYTFLNVSDRRDYAFGDNNLLYISASGGNILRYDLANNVYLTPFAVGGTPNGIDLSPNGTTLAVADSSTQGATIGFNSSILRTGIGTPISFVRQSLESGTYMAGDRTTRCWSPATLPDRDGFRSVAMILQRTQQLPWHPFVRVRCSLQAPIETPSGSLRPISAVAQ